MQNNYHNNNDGVALSYLFYYNLYFNLYSKLWVNHELK